jgi:hypothetical protein
MTSNNWLAVFILTILGLTGYMIATRPKLDDLGEIKEEEWWC